MTFILFRFGNAPAPLISREKGGKVTCASADFTSSSFEALTFPRNFRVRWMFSRSTGFRSPPREESEDIMDSTCERIFSSSRSIETKLRIWPLDNSSGVSISLPFKRYNCRVCQPPENRPCDRGDQRRQYLSSSECPGQVRASLRA